MGASQRYGATCVCNSFLASDWFFSYARKFLSTHVGSELRASIVIELCASVTVSLILIGGPGYRKW